MVSQFIPVSPSLEQEFRFCIDPSDWFLIGRFLNISNFAFQFDETWLVSKSPLKIARIRNQAGSVSVSYKTVLSSVESVEESLDLTSASARSFFDKQYKKDITISKLRGQANIQDLIICLDMVEGVGHCLEIEGPNDHLKKEILSCLKLDPSYVMEGYGFYVRGRVRPSPVPLSLGNLYLLQELQ